MLQITTVSPSVSYTHLDVYKRQVYINNNGTAGNTCRFIKTYCTKQKYLSAFACQFNDYMYQYPFSKHFLFYFSSFSCRPCHTATKHSFSISIHSPLASFSKLIRSIKRIFIWYTKTYTGRRNTNTVSYTHLDVYKRQIMSFEI